MKENSAYDFDLMDVLSEDDICVKIEEPKEKEKPFGVDIEFNYTSVNNSSQEAIDNVLHHITAIFLAYFRQRCKKISVTLYKDALVPKLKIEVLQKELNSYDLMHTMLHLSKIPGVKKYALGSRTSSITADMLRNRIDYYNYRNTVTYINRAISNSIYDWYANENGVVLPEKELTQEDKENTRYIVWRTLGKDNYSVNEHIIGWFLSNAEKDFVGSGYKSISTVEKMTLNPEKINDVLLYIVRSDMHGDLYFAPKEDKGDREITDTYEEDIKAEEEQDVRITEELKQHFIDNLDKYPCYTGMEIKVKHQNYSWVRQLYEKMYGAYFGMVYDGRHTGFCFALMLERFDEKERTRCASRDFKSYFI